MLGIIESANQAMDVIMVDVADYASWLAGRSDEERLWLDRMGFQGKVRSVCVMPGGIPSYVAVVDTNDFWGFAHLPDQLPEGAYRCVGAFTAQAYEALVVGWSLACYRFKRYTSKDPSKACLIAPEQVDVAALSKLVDAITHVRDWVNTPAEDLGPQELAEQAVSLFQDHRGRSRVLSGQELIDQNYPLIHAVGRASARPPCLVDCTWGDREHPKLTLVGKGVCFDTGGLNLKPGAGMATMKKDMGGAAHALALAELIMSHELPVCLRLLLPAVENAVGGNSYRPGDVFYARNGLTVENTNTDAEGRLILADALTEACYDEPDLLIDFATLTGAARVALGPDLPALFASREDTAHDVVDQGRACQDPLWQMPLYEPYDEMLKSDIADLVNAPKQPYGGAITAALFLKRFVTPEQDWIHVDLMAANTRSLPGRPQGGEAMGLRAIFAYLQNRYTSS